MYILVTGGAGFIGTHLVRRLVDLGHEITVLDNFLPQIHDGRTSLDQTVPRNVRLIRGDVADPAVVNMALECADAIVHLAAETGTGQSMYEVERYARTNLYGTALLFDLLVKNPKNVRRFICASSRAIYGEGAYRCEIHQLVYPKSRASAEKSRGLFDPVCPICGGPILPVPTAESAPSSPSSFYGLTKLTQEQMTLLFGDVLGIPSIALRYQNVYGPGQSLKNPYTGILAIFSGLARTGKPIRVFEDGRESRDFVYVEDVVDATAQALIMPFEGTRVFNVGSGRPTTVLEVAKQISAFFGNQSEIRITGEFREGDIRHGFADLTAIRDALKFEARWNFCDGLSQFLRWAERHPPSTQRYEQSLSELRSRGLFHG